MQGPLIQITSAAKRQGAPLETFLEMLEDRFEDTYPHSHVYTFQFHSKAGQKLVMEWWHEIVEDEEFPVYAYGFENDSQGGVLHIRIGTPLHGSAAAQALDATLEEWREEYHRIASEPAPLPWTVTDVKSKNLDKEYTAHQWRKLISAHRAKGL